MYEDLTEGEARAEPEFLTAGDPRAYVDEADLIGLDMIATYGEDFCKRMGLTIKDGHCVWELSKEPIRYVKPEAEYLRHQPLNVPLPLAGEH